MFQVENRHKTRAHIVIYNMHIGKNIKQEAKTQQKITEEIFTEPKTYENVL